MSAHRRRAGIVAALLALPTFALASPAAATTADEAATTTAAEGTVEPGTLVGGRVTKQGWWSRSNQPPPETGVLAPPSVPAPAAPKGTLPVAQVTGEPERISALQFTLDGKKDDMVDSVVLALRESADPTLNPNSTGATVFACPITEFWIGVENGPWSTLPAYDCSTGSVQGVRDDKGVWTFDLTPLAFDWLSSATKLPPAVVFVSSTTPEGTAPDPAAGPPTSFQVAYDAAQGLGLLAKTSAPPKSGGGGGGGGNNDDDDSDTSDDSGTGGGSSGGGDSGGASSGGGTIGTAGGGGEVDLGTGAAPDPGAAAPVEESAPAADDAGAETAAAPVLAPVSAVPWHDGLGRGALLLLPVALLLAYACMLALGPAGQPVAGQGRRGVSRALERLRATGAAIGQGKARS